MNNDKYVTKQLSKEQKIRFWASWLIILLVLSVLALDIYASSIMHCH